MKRFNKFIASTTQISTFSKPIQAPYFRKSFNLKTKDKTVLYIAVAGLYELYFNGNKITKGILAPYISNPDDLIYYDEYDITGFIQEGKNTVAVLLGNGMQNCFGGEIWNFHVAPWVNSPRFSMSILQGEQSILESDESFKVCNSPILLNDLRVGEHVDNRLSVNGWNAVDFDDSSWLNAIIVDSPKGEIKKCNVEPIKIEKELSAISISKVGNGYLYDFGENNAGIIRLKPKSRRGTKIVLSFGEYLKGGTLCRENLLFEQLYIDDFVQKDVYICSGEQDELYESSFTYHGFRYALVEGINKEEATKEFLTYLVCHSDIKTIGTIEFDNEKLNLLQEITVRSDLSNFFYFPTDCPHREKNGWTGDIYLSAEQYMYNFDGYASFRQWLEQLRYCQLENGVVPGIIPADPLKLPVYGPAWDGVIVELPLQMFRFTGEIKYLDENKEAIKKYIKYMADKRKENGLISFGLGDWCPVGKDSANDYDTSLEFICSAYYLKQLRESKLIFSLLGDKEFVQYSESLYEELLSKVKNNYVVDGRVTEQKQTGLALAIKFKLLNEEEEKRAVQDLVSLIESNNSLMTVGVLGARYIFEVLAENNYVDLAYKMIMQDKFPSYGYYLNRGATALWENFYELADDNVNWTRKDGGKLSSLNHHFWGHVSGWLYKYLGGLLINPNYMNHKSVVIAPNVIDSVKKCNVTYSTKFGRCIVKYTVENGKFNLNVDIPAEIECKVVLPNGKQIITNQGSFSCEV